MIILRVSKKSVFSDLNNLEVVTTTSEKYTDCFGFTEEVFASLDEFGLSDRKEEVKNWYDGVTFGNRRDIYNHWLILNYLDKKKLALLLFQGQSIMYNSDNMVIDVAFMFGFVKIKNECVVVANRIFETCLYNMFLSLSEMKGNETYREALQDRNQFIEQNSRDKETCPAG